MTIEILAGKKLPHVGDTQWLHRHLNIIPPVRPGSICSTGRVDEGHLKKYPSLFAHSQNRQVIRTWPLGMPHHVQHYWLRSDCRVGVARGVP